MLSKTAMTYFVYGIIGIVAASILAGFFVVGSPFEERVRRFDDKRLADLQFIQSEIINHWVSKEKLPANLSEIRDDIRGVSIPSDPETGGAYEYRVVNNLTFSLCANFSRPSRNAASETTPKPLGDPYYQENWMHGEGNHCFERTIDPDLYKPIEKARAIY